MRLPDDEDPDGGIYHDLVPMEIKEGTIIAYLIKEDDKNLEHPIGRMLIKPFHNTAVDAKPEDIYMVACTGGYGTVPKDFIEQVIEWTKKLNKKVKYGKYKIRNDFEQTHVPFDTVRHLPNNLEDLVKTNNFTLIDTFDGLVKNWKKYRYDLYANRLQGQPYNVHWVDKLLFSHDKILKDFTEKKFMKLLNDDLDTAEKVFAILTFMSKNTSVDKKDLILKMFKEKEKKLPL